MASLPFNHLNATEFESFVYDLLGEIGFQNRSWRRGSPQATSAPDGGRDIECVLQCKEIDGSFRLEKWLVECKHWPQNAVPLSALTGVLDAARTLRPDKVLIVCSGHLSNPARDSLQVFEHNNRPSFRVITWENPQLRQLAAGKLILLTRYGLPTESPLVAIIHPLHLEFMRLTPRLSLDVLFGLLDGIESSRRDAMLNFATLVIINPRTRRSTSPDDRLGDLVDESITYYALKAKCASLSEVLSPSVVARLVTDLALQYLLTLADTTGSDERVRLHERLLASFRADREVGRGDPHTVGGVIQVLEDGLRSMPTRMEDNRRTYHDFCEAVLRPLLLRATDLRMAAIEAREALGEL